MLQRAIEVGIPVLGICKGHQMINVYFGGSIVQHLPSAEFHTGKEGMDAIHQIEKCISGCGVGTQRTSNPFCTVASGAYELRQAQK